MSEPLSDEQVQTKALAIARTFTPNAPVTEQELFAGRADLLVRVLIAASQRQHVAIYGRPGVGKQSLANMIAPALGEQQRIVVHRGRPEAPLEAGEATIVVAGVADSAEGLMPGAAGFLLPPMTAAEMRAVVDRNFSRLSMTIDDDAKALIAAMAHGQPRYAHLLGQYAALDVVLHGRSTHVARANVETAMKRAIAEAPASITAAWRQATSSKRVNLFQEVLLACALSPKHALGWFTSTGVTDALRMITGKRYQVRRFSRHLREFSETRGPILQRAGKLYEYFYRFVNPLMESWVVLKSTTDGLWDPKRGLLE